MVNEFDLGDYETARDLANAIKQNAENINEIFNNMTETMNKLAQDWQSEGSREVQAMYESIKAKYPIFHQRIIADTNHILSVVASDEDADAASKAVFENAG